ncbi:ASN_HP2_G0013550.mRNA.1.CDS.1 [Saccharomyces cerevisiae]|nr:ASN_HP2_G0013550.mRNA.1.CDS.1 [Saccharomyces cerevisiae]CAI6539239.1 ASN_HP2_G0013550.mRNA.1.CDS.1 [Saccharomyces cerevisiae]
MTNRRVNAIEHVIIPRTENTIAYINKKKQNETAKLDAQMKLKRDRAEQDASEVAADEEPQGQHLGC